MIVVGIERNRSIQSRPGQTHAEPVLPSQAPRERSLQWLWKGYVAHDEDHNVVGSRREHAGRITILRVDETTHVTELGLDVARACGFKTTQSLCDAWALVHPRSPELRIVWFALGDWRDRDKYLNYTGRAGGDFTYNRARAMDSEAPVPEEIAEGYAIQNRQKDEGRRAKTSVALVVQPASQRLLRLLRYVEYIRNTQGEEAAKAVYGAIRQHLRVVEQRITRAESRKE